MTHTYFATVSPDLLPLAQKELETLGAQWIQPQAAGIEFQGDRRLLYQVNLWSRYIFRVLMKVKTLKAFDEHELYGQVQTIDWSQFLNPDRTFAVNCTGQNKNLNHSHFTALKIKNAIIDQQRQQFQGDRSDIDPQRPDVQIHAHIHRYRLDISIDSSGDSLHRRGYRPAMGLAPLKETLAAGLVTMARWQPHQTLYDPFCGSGTFLIEAALQGFNIAPGLYREHFGFQSWLDFDPDLWDELCELAEQQQHLDQKLYLHGSDRLGEVLKQAKNNGDRCGFAEEITWTQQDLEDIAPPTATGVLICNPPYGKRLGEVSELETLYRQLGEILKSRFSGWTVYILSGNKKLTQCLGMKAFENISVSNGGLPCRFLGYEIF